MSSDAAVLFEADIVPYRSLSRRILWRIIGFLCTVSFGVSLLFWSLGAWPVAGFNGAELTTAVVLLRLHARSRRVREVLRLSEHDLRIRRFDEGGDVRETRLSPDWLTVRLEERTGRVPALWLASHGAREEIAARLGEAEKRDLAEALGAALHRRRHPVFDNPQLHDPKGPEVSRPDPWI